MFRIQMYDDVRVRRVRALNHGLVDPEMLRHTSAEVQARQRLRTSKEQRRRSNGYGLLLFDILLFLHVVVDILQFCFKIIYLRNLPS